MQAIDYSRLEHIVNRFSGIRVLVVGDLILDEFIWGKVSRISPEAPIPVVWEKSKSFIPGGACNVANNIRSIQGETEVVGVVGGEGLGRMLIDLLKEKKIGVTGVFKDLQRPTTLKTRVIAHHQQVVRIDRESTDALPAALQKRILNHVKSRMAAVDAVCIEDYGKGVITPQLIKTIIALAKKSGKVVTVDPKEDHLSYYRHVTSITPNNHEASTLSGILIKDDASLYKAGQKLLRRLQCHNVLITLGEQGMCVFQKGKKPVKIPTLAQDVFDVSGAGDTVIGTYTLALAQGATPLEAAFLANCAGGIVVGKVGTATVTQSELLKRISEVVSSTSSFSVLKEA